MLTARTPKVARLAIAARPRPASSSSSTRRGFLTPLCGLPSTHSAANADFPPLAVLVAGGSGVALEAARALVAKGASVSAFAKTEAGRAALVGAGASNVHDGDALDPSDVARCMAALGTCGVDAVVSAAGTSAADAPADGDGNLALIQAAAAKGVKRFVLITSIGCGSSSSAPPHAPHEAYKSHEPALLQADRAEVRLRTVAGDFGMGFTILRPGDLSDAPASGTAMLTEDASAWVVGHAISRADVGRLAADALFSDHARGRTLSVVDPGRAHGEPRPAAFQL